MVNFCFLFCVWNAYSLDHNSLHDFTFVPSCLLYMQLHIIITYLQKIIQICTNSWSLKLRKKLVEKERKLNTMNNIETTPSWLFLHVQCKVIFQLSFLHQHLLIINNMLNNVSISTWSLTKQCMFISQWHGMLK
jgi:hypothetical protein